MSKRSNFEKIPRDYYPTPIDAVRPLVNFLPKEFTFVEPCAGDGRLIDHIETLIPNSECVFASDLEPQGEDIEELDALDLSDKHLYDCDFIITNPPWTRTKKSGYIFHNLITHFSDMKPTWLLADADWVHTIQSSDYVADRLCSIVSIGRVKWFNNISGKDNCCWYLFDFNKQQETKFYGR